MLDTAEQMHECECDESRLFVRAYWAKVQRDARNGFIELVCGDCGSVFRYELNDCFVLGDRQQIAVH